MTDARIAELADEIGSRYIVWCECGWLLAFPGGTVLIRNGDY